MRTYSLYILASRPGGALYVGVTNNLSHRARRSEHTARYGIAKLVYYETYEDVRFALQRERNLKHWPRAWKTNLVASANPTGRDLYEALAQERLGEAARLTVSGWLRQARP